VQGFARIKEEIVTEEDFVPKDDAGGEDEENEQIDMAAEKKQKFKTRKWWVNRLLGRELKIELAEDDQLRYQKRFGRGARAAAATAGKEAPQAGAPSVNVEA